MLGFRVNRVHARLSSAEAKMTQRSDAVFEQPNLPVQPKSELKRIPCLVKPTESPKPKLKALPEPRRMLHLVRGHAVISHKDGYHGHETDSVLDTTPRGLCRALCGGLGSLADALQSEAQGLSTSVSNRVVIGVTPAGYLQLYL